jgi:SAM-dependent methyltransferase
MEHEGMVHALEEIHRLLKPAGTLIEIHPSVDAPPFVEVRSNGRLSFAEGDPVFDYEDDLRQADAAVATVLDRSVFVLDDRRGFQLRTYAASVKELRDRGRSSRSGSRERSAGRWGCWSRTSSPSTSMPRSPIRSRTRRSTTCSSRASGGISGSTSCRAH